ncbi:MAG: polysaccharide export protein EpsE [Rhodocyclaceae bacterium]|nr:polysaccharide export protein EpsE [Rhodocyclaceae bacterium]MCB1912481.1 polysaccharide export protein EpsE [Rhodocyclaceae bacterium]MCP5241780.1 polysaccharide export protein EpsE [Zoogloeaceae bacterium]MCP5256168.1 polysaccharide export protein EpsE [Zoogloeaceae bacterium]MCW5616830.1 polysaccharide export protein EpsE [Rhodocyclaceae bacterium]
MIKRFFQQLSTRLGAIAALVLLGLAGPAAAQDAEYALGAGDIVRITVFQNPDLTTETRVSENGTVTFPLIGNVELGGQTIAKAEQTVASKLREGGFVLKPQVNILPLQIRGNQIAVLGQVNRPGRYPLETFNTRLSDMLATAGGIAASGADTVVLIGVRDGKSVRREIDLPTLFAAGSDADNEVLSGGDVIYVHRAPVFYIYGEVQRPGAFRLERNMSVMQGLATGGGTSARGTVKGLQVHRRDADGKLQVIEPKMDDLLKPDDVIYIKESLF